MRWAAAALLAASVGCLVASGPPKLPPDTPSWRTVTGVFIGLWLLQLFVYDVLARVYGGNDATVSAVLLDASKLWPVIPLLFGIIIGHIWWAVR